MIKNLSSKELKNLAIALENLENKLLKEHGLDKETGGYVEASMFDYNDDIIEVAITYGIQCGSNKDFESSHSIELNRITLEQL